MDSSYAMMGGLIIGYLVVYLIVIVLMIAAYWSLFSKAGQHGWASLIPIYNTYIMLKIGGKPGWWLLLFLIPVVNVVIGIMALSAFLKAYGRGGAGSVLLALFFGIIYFPYLAFSSSVQYTGTGISA